MSSTCDVGCKEIRSLRPSASRSRSALPSRQGLDSHVSDPAKTSLATPRPFSSVHWRICGEAALQEAQAKNQTDFALIEAKGTDP
jgi:hypothetical protein